MNDGEPVETAGSIAVLRFALLSITTLGIVGTAAELAIERHWQNLEQWYAWLALAVATAGLVAMLKRWRASLWFARLCAVVAIAFAVVGVWRHINANYQTAPLDVRYETRWDDMSVRERLWDVVTGEVGAAPILASGVLATIGIALGAATIGVTDPPPRTDTPPEDIADA